MRFFFEFLDNLKQVGLEWYHKYYAVYPGVVVSTDDPEQRGRIQLSLPSILEEGEILENWAEPAGAALAGDQTGAFFPPYVDDIVDIIFENGNVNFPKYLPGGFWAEDELHPDFIAGYGADGPTVRGWIFKSGQKIIVDETTDKVKFQIVNGDTGGIFTMDDTVGKESISFNHKTGSLLQLDKDGNMVFATPSGNLVYLNEKTGEMTIKSADGSIISLKDKITVSDASGKNLISITDSSVEVTSSSDVILTAKTVNLKAGTLSLGDGASDNAVLYSKLAAIIDGLIVLTPLGPSSTPIPPMTMAITENNPALSAKAKNVLLKGNLP